MDPSSKLRRTGAAAGALLAVATFGRPALAIPACSSLPAPIYAAGGSGPLPILAQVAAALSNATPPQTLVYQSSTACAGVDAIVPVGGAQPTPLTGTADYWTSASTTLTCSLPITGQAADVAVSGTYATYCSGLTSGLPSGYGDTLGPIQSFDFIVPLGETGVTSISAQAAYFIYGFGATSPYVVNPWNNATDIIKRSSTAASAIILGLAIGIPATSLAPGGTTSTSDQNTVALVGASGTTAGTSGIGFVSGAVASANLSTISVLAYQATGQSCGYWPSSTPTALDQINVRNGHYALWSPLHFIAAASDTTASNFIGYFTGSVTPPAGVDIPQLTVKGGGILECAMEVQRQNDLGPVSPYAPAAPCGCFFEATATGTTTCQACTANYGSDAGTTCPVNAPNCRLGYCEVN